MTIHDKHTAAELIKSAAELLRAEFETIRKTVPHYGESGEEVENIVRTFLNSYLPKRFRADPGFILDSKNQFVEAVLRQISETENVPLRTQAPRSIVKTLYFYGLLNKNQLMEFEEGAKMRNILVHGFAAPQLDSKKIRQLLQALEKLLPTTKHGG
ncbi:MAG: DUF6602 domain-containing protein [Bacteroidota bacterium]